MRKHDLLSSSIWFIVGFFIVLLSPQFDIGTLSVPGPGFMPFVSGILICIFSVVTFFQAYLAKINEVQKVWVNIQFKRIILVVIVLCMYVFCLKIAGYFICTFVSILFLIRFTGSETWRTSFLGASLTSILTYLLFNTFLQSPLPKGVLGF